MVVLLFLIHFFPLFSYYTFSSISSNFPCSHFFYLFFIFFAFNFSLSLFFILCIFFFIFYLFFLCASSHFLLIPMFITFSSFLLSLSTVFKSSYVVNSRIFYFVFCHFFPYLLFLFILFSLLFLYSLLLFHFLPFFLFSFFSLFFLLYNRFYLFIFLHSSSSFCCFSSLSYIYHVIYCSFLLFNLCQLLFITSVSSFIFSSFPFHYLSLSM